MDGAKVSVLNCDFGQTELTETVVSCTGSDLTVRGCYLQGIQVRLMGSGVTWGIHAMCRDRWGRWRT